MSLRFQPLIFGGFGETGTGGGGPTGPAGGELAGTYPNPDLAISVLAFKADPTGVLDSTKAFKEALAAHNAVYAPAGTYNLTEATTSPIELGGKTLFGDGQASTKFTVNSLVASMFTVKTPFATLRNFTIENLKTEPTSGAFIKLAPTTTSNYTDITLESITINNAFVGIETEGNLAFATLQDIRIYEYQSIALYLTNGADALTVTDFFFKAPIGSGTATGIKLAAFVPGCVFENGEVLGGQYGLVASSGTNTVGTAPQACRFSNIFFDTQAGETGKAGSSLTNCTQMTFTGCWWADTNGGLELVEGCESIVFEGCEWYANGIWGCFVGATNVNTHFIGCGFRNNSGLVAVTNPGLEVAANTGYFVVQGCSFGRPEAAVQEARAVVVAPGTSDHYVIADNVFGYFANEVPEPIPPVVDGGTGTHKRVEQGPRPLLAGTPDPTLKPSTERVAGELIPGETGGVRRKVFILAAEAVEEVKKLKHNYETEAIGSVTAFIYAEEKWKPLAVVSFAPEGLNEVSVKLAAPLKAQVAAKAPTSETAEGASLINMTGSLAAGYTNGRRVHFTAVNSTTGLNNTAGLYYYIVGAVTNGFEVSPTFGGAGHKMTKKMTVAVTKVEVLADEVKFAVDTDGTSTFNLMTLTGNQTVEGVKSFKEAPLLTKGIGLWTHAAPVGQHAALPAPKTLLEVEAWAKEVDEVLKEYGLTA